MIDNNLKFCREELELTQTELGKIFNVSKQTISGWENAADIIPLKKLIKFCVIYNYSLDFVVGFNKNYKKSKCYCETKPTKIMLSKNLKNFRNKLEITQQNLANDCGLSRSTYAKYESGTQMVSTIALCSICKKYNISMDWLCERTKEQKLIQ